MSDNHAPLITSLHPIDHASAQGKSKDVLDIALKQVGFIPNMYANMANAPAMLSTYLHGYALFRSESGFTPAEQEVVFLVVSQYNGCNYCTAAHSMLADKMSGVPKDVLQAIRARAPIPDAKLAALAAMAVEMVAKHGQPDRAVVQAFLGAGYQERDLLYIVLAAAVKVLSNYSNQAFRTTVDDKFAPYKVD
ncbi:MAG: carboxymuconolactone decarboxylase family protein [Rhodoferax sp.]|nr:carboxymuconolactone decarboxylase family protein [Betaproteobacteria bacterium]NCN96215.1 carboxymuconolactone decarboxylase family protein [Rhodoferax sp.]OIP14315.1 MAG: alkylhydroperoxidase [Comamonadaceae bacterium CG2_30_57_122]PIZ22695.1 MAG: alkylhydroperoxidase [Comamonadaceae bacterium CG_4_10_14_0_8_um_filter_57_29]PJC21016.1 MAG: alkylhydroperoxidase [Comamonadaceae bacterium CG_4_9_14_0_8_um_filter_57_21]